jgi:hydroxymethylglutaryl-CoA lyase
MNKITLNEIGPREWKLSYRTALKTDNVYEVIRELEKARIERIEIGGSLDYNKHPYMEDTFELLRRLKNKQSEKHARYSVYVGGDEEDYPRKKIENLLEKGLLVEDSGMPDELSFSVSKDEKRNRERTGLPRKKLFRKIKRHIERGNADGVKFFRGYIPDAFDSEDKENFNAEEVIRNAQLFFNMGCYEVALGNCRSDDSVLDFKKKLTSIKKDLPLEKIAIHFHENFFVCWEAKTALALREGIKVFDTSIMDPLNSVSKEECAFFSKGNMPPTPSTEKMIYLIEGYSEDFGIESFTGLNYIKIQNTRRKMERFIENKFKPSK